LATENVRRVDSPGLMVDGEKDFVRVGVRTTRQLGCTALETFETVTFPESLVKGAGFPEQLALVCSVAFVTLTVTVQVDAPAGTCRFDTVIVLPLAIVAAAAFTHVPPTEGGLATASPAGKASTKPTFDSGGAPSGLATLNVRTDASPGLMADGEKDFVRTGGLGGNPARAGTAAIATARPVSRQTAREIARDRHRARGFFIQTLRRRMLKPPTESVHSYSAPRGASRTRAPDLPRGLRALLE